MTKKSETKDEFPENDAPKKPDEKTEKSTKEIRQEKWDKVSNKIENTTDQIGCSIDEKIKETVVALNVFDVNTRQSCEGHNDDYGAGTPWVQIEAANEPEELYKGQEETLKKVAKDNGISVEDLKKEKKFEELYEEAMTRCEKNGETEESVAWQEENKKLRMIMEEIVSDFYKERTVSEDIKIRFNDIGIWGSFRIISGTEEDYDKDFKNMNEQEKEELGKRLEGYRKEMDDFTFFLKDKFFTEGEGYANSKRIKAQERIDREKLEELRKINIDWKEFWKKEGLSMPSRKEVFPNGEDRDMSDEQVVEFLNDFLKKGGLTYDNYTGINAEEFPEMVDEDIRKLCVNLNSLPFLRTREGCGGHEFYRSTGEFYKSGYADPYLLFYANKKNAEAELFLKRLQRGFQEFKKSDFPGIENVILNFHDEATETENVRLYWNKMFIVPTKEWCEKNGRKYVERPKELGFYDQWCQDNGYEYSDDEESLSRKKWEEIKKKYWEEMEDFEKEYVEYFRSEEARKLRDKFFEVFENSVSAKQEINQEINHSLNTIRKTGLFDPNFLDKVVLVSSGDKKTYKFQEGRTEEVSREEFDLIEFMQGKRTDFVGINPKEEFEKYDVAELNDKQFLPFMFFEGKLSYDEFVAHEIAHNVFDREYIKKFGQYEIKENITDVSEEYREKIKGIIIPLIKENYPRIEAEKFSFNRQKIAEIFSLLYQREFCKKVDVNAETHDKVGEILEKFSENPELALSEFNKKYGRNCTMDDFYEENRILSLVVAPLLEKEYPNWKERVGLFFK